MKIRGIVFSGVMSAILMSVVGAKAATLNLASKSYVDDALAQKQNTLTAGEGIDITDNVVKSTIDTSKFAMKDEIPGLGAFATDEELGQLKATLEAAIAEKQDKGDYASATKLQELQDVVNDLQTGGADKTVVENLKATVEAISADYAKKSELTSVETDLQKKIDSIVVPSLEGYAKSADVAATYATKDSLSGYATTGDLDSYAKSADVAATYATKASLADYAKASDLATKAEANVVNTLQQSVTNIENTYLTQEAAQNTYVTENKVTEQITQVVGTDTSGLKKQVADNTVAIADKANAADVYSKTDADSRFLIMQDANALGANLQWDEDGKLNTKGIATAEGLEELENKVADAVTETELAAKGYQTSTEVQGAITTAVADLATKSEVNAKQDKLTAGSNITIANGTISADVDLSGLATSQALTDLQTALEASIAEKQEKGEYLVASDLKTLNDAVTALQNGKADASTVTTIQETINGLGNTYATKSDMTTADAELRAAIEAINVPSLEGYVKASELATVATTGSYADLKDKPTIPSIEGLATSQALTDLQTALEASIAEKQEKGEYLVASDLKTLNDAVSALQSGKADASTVTAIQESISKLGETYATKADMTAADAVLQSAIDSIDLSAYAKIADVYTKTEADAKFLIMQDANALGANLQWDEDGKLNTKGIVTAEGLEELENKVADAVTETELAAKGYQTSTEVQGAITTATSTLATKDELAGKQDKLTAGDGISITDNTISANVDTSGFVPIPELPTEFGEWFLTYNIDINGVPEGYTWTNSEDLTGGVEEW